MSSPSKRRYSASSALSCASRAFLKSCSSMLANSASAAAAAARRLLALDLARVSPCRLLFALPLPFPLASVAHDHARAASLVALRRSRLHLRRASRPFWSASEKIFRWMRVGRWLSSIWGKPGTAKDGSNAPGGCGCVVGGGRRTVLERLRGLGLGVGACWRLAVGSFP